MEGISGDRMFQSKGRHPCTGPVGGESKKLSDGRQSILVIGGSAPDHDQATTAQPPLAPLQGQSYRTSPHLNQPVSRGLRVQDSGSQGSSHSVRCRFCSQLSLSVPLGPTCGKSP